MNCNKTLADANITAFSGQDTECVVDWALKTVKAMRAASCGEGVFCRGGLQQLDLIITDIAGGLAKENDLDLLREITTAMMTFADCGLAKDGAKLISDTLTANEADWVMHIKRKKCRTLRCPKLTRFYIEPASCTGCGKCRLQVPGLAPTGAVLGGEGEIHIIPADKGIGLDALEPLCKAVKRCDPKGVAPKVPEKPVPVGSFAAAPAPTPGAGLGRPGLGGGVRRGRR